MKRKFTFLIAAALMLLTMMATTGTMWGQTTVTFTPGTDTGANSVTKGDITATMTTMNNSSYYQIYANQSGTFSTSNGTITNIEFTCTASGTTKYGPGNASANVGTYTYSGYNGYWTGNAESVTISSTAQVRMTSLSITYTPAGGGGGDTPSLSVTPTAIDFGSKEINPDEPYTETFTVTYANLSENLTVSVGEGLTGISVSPQQISKDGDGNQVVTVSYNPTSEGEISGNITVSNTEDELSKTVAVSGSSYDPTSVVIYERYTGAIVEGDYIIYNTNGAMKNVISSNRFANANVTVNNNTITNPEASIVWHIAADGDYWTIYNAEVNKYAGGTTSKNQGALLDEADDHARWIITYQYSNFTIENYGRSQDNSDPANRYLRQNTTASAGWATYGSGTGYVPTLYKKAGATTYSVTYNANGATSGTVPTDNTAYSNGATVSVLGNTGNLAKTGFIWSGWNTQADGDGTPYQADETFEITASTTLYAMWTQKTITGLAYTGTPTATQYDGQAFNPAGLTVTATFNDASQEDVTSQVVWTPNPLTIETTSVTGTYMEQTVNVEGITVTYAPGTENNPYTVAEAMAATPTSGTSANVYIHGIVSAFYNTSIVGDGSNYRYYISDDGTTTSQLLVYKGKGLNNETFSNANDLLIGDIVTIYGGLTMYQSEPEIASGNYLTSLERPAVDVEAPTYSIPEGGYAEAQTVTITCATDGATIYYTLDGSTPNNTSTTYSTPIAVSATTTIKAIAYVGESSSTVSSATYYIKSTGNTYTVTAALGFDEYPVNNIFVQGIVSTAPTSLLDGGLLTYYVSVDGEATNQLQVYKGKNLGNTAFTEVDDIQVGDIVTIFGNVKIYNNQKEFDQGNYLVEFERKVATPTFNPAAGEYPSTQNVTIACATEGATIYYTTNGTDPTTESTEYTAAIPVATTTTIKAIAIKEGMNNSAIATAEYTIILTPTVTVTPNAINAPAAGADGTLALTYENITDFLGFDYYFCDVNGEELEENPDWIDAEINEENETYTLDYIIGANDGDARTAYIKIYTYDDNLEEVYAIVTVNQAEYVVDYATLPFEFDGGRADIATTTGLTQEGLESDYASSPKLKFNGTGDWVILKINERPGILTFDINGNSFSGGTFKIQTSADGETYTDLQSYTDLGATQSEEFDNLGENVRYIKWIYTNKSSGNVGLGNIALAKYVAPVPSITVAGGNANIAVDADGVEAASLTLTYINLTITENTDFDIQYYDGDGNELGKDDQPDWMEASIQAAFPEGYEVSYSVSTNDSDARTAYFKVWALDDNADEVYSNLVTINQAEAVATATITVAGGDANIDVDAEGVENASLTLTYTNLTITDPADFDIQYYDGDGNELGKDDQPDWMEASIQAASPEGYEVSYSVSANDSDARTAYFKVYKKESEIYSNLVTVTQAGYVPPVVTDDYELFSGNLVEGDYIIYYNGYAMKDDVDSNRLKYEEVTPENDVISTSDATIVWHIAQNGNYWTIYSADAVAYAASTGTKNQATLYQGTPDSYDKALWTASGTSTYEFVNKHNFANDINANLRNNGTYGFACYATGTGGALSLYKKADNTPTISFNGPSANIGTYPTGEEITWDNIIVSQHNLTENISLSAKKGTVTPTSIVADAEPTEVVWSYTPTTAGYTVDTITATSGTVEATFLIQFVAKTPHNINIASVENGTIAVVGGKTTEIEGENVDFTVTPDEGYVIDEITVMAGETPVDYIQGETFYRFQMPDSDVTISATFTALPTYTVSFSVNGTVDSELTETVTTGSSIEDLPTESTLTPDGFTIYGWAEANSTEAVAEPYEPTDNVTLYALLKLENAPATSENYVKVTEELTDWSGEYLIVYEDGEVAFDGSLEVLDVASNTIAVTITNNTIVATATTDDSKFTIAALSEGGYSIQSASGYYIGQTSDANGLLSSTETVYANTLSYDTENECVNVISSGGPYMRYNSNSGQNRFRYFKSSTYTGQQAIQLYKKTSGAAIPTIVNVEYVSDTTEMTDNIPASTSYVVESGAVLTFTGTNEGTAANLVVQEGGQLIHTADVEATVQKSVSGYTNKSGDGWYLIASPVDNYSTSTIATGTYDLFIYNEPNAYWYSSTGAAAPFNTLERGKGYLYANAANVNLNYAGTMKATNANIKVDLSYACDEYPYLKGFNLVGNPFTRNITAADMVIGDTAVTSYYDFNADRTEFVTYQTIERPIQPGQGFFIQAKGNAQQLVFNPTTPPTKDASDFKYISISAGDENFTDKAYIQFGYGNTLRKMTFGENTMVYVMNDDLDYAAARVEELAGTMPVHFVPIEDGFYTITVETKNIENLNYMHLIDNIKNTEIDLLVEPSYTFKASESDNADRFYLVFDFNNYTGVNENYTNGNFAHQIGDEIFVSGEGTLQVFDVLGRFVTGYNVNGDKRISTAEFNTGVYIFRMVGTEVKTQKIIVR